MAVGVGVLTMRRILLLLAHHTVHARTVVPGCAQMVGVLTVPLGCILQPAGQCQDVHPTNLCAVTSCQVLEF